MSVTITPCPLLNTTSVTIIEFPCDVQWDLLDTFEKQRGVMNSYTLHTILTMRQRKNLQHNRVRTPTSAQYKHNHSTAVSLARIIYAEIVTTLVSTESHT
jgi:hypothetical protein